MGVELKLGDKIWMHYGPSVMIVGHIVDVSPKETSIGVSPIPFDEYQEMTLMEKASCPVSWCELRACHYLCHIAYGDLKQMDEAKKKPAFGFVAGVPK